MEERGDRGDCGTAEPDLTGRLSGGGPIPKGKKVSLSRRILFPRPAVQGRRYRRCFDGYRRLLGRRTSHVTEQMSAQRFARETSIRCSVSSSFVVQEMSERLVKKKKSWMALSCPPHESCHAASQHPNGFPDCADPETSPGESLACN